MKKCVIENAQFAYIIYVNGKKVASLIGGSSADYFGTFFKDLGYEVIRIRTSDLNHVETGQERKKVGII